MLPPDRPSFHAPCPESGTRGIVGLESDGLGVILYRPLDVAFVVARKAPELERVGIVGLEPDRLTVKAQPFVNIGGSEPSLEPLLSGQLFFLDRRSCASRRLLFCRGLFH